MIQVTVFSKPMCQQCRATERKLLRLGVNYSYVDTSTDVQARDEVISAGFSSAPVVKVVDGDNIVAMWAGYRNEALTALSVDGVDMSAYDERALVTRGA